MNEILGIVIGSLICTSTAERCSLQTVFGNFNSPLHRSAWQCAKEYMILWYHIPIMLLQQSPSTHDWLLTFLLISCKQNRGCPDKRHGNNFCSIYHVTTRQNHRSYGERNVTPPLHNRPITSHLDNSITSSILQSCCEASDIRYAINLLSEQCR